MTYMQPVLPLLLLALAAGVVFRKMRLLYVVVALLFLWSWQPVSAVVAGSLEWWYPIRHFPAGDPEAIVVLSGGLLKHDASVPEDVLGADSNVRISYASWLYHNWRPLPIVVSGGLTSGHRPVVLAEVMRRVLIEKGVPPSMIWLEGRSSSTYENALYSAELLRGKGIHKIALVTEAHHMLRSEKAFLHQGLAVTPSPCAYRYIRFTGDLEQFVPDSKAIETNDLGLHEWLGLLWYKLSGKI